MYWLLDHVLFLKWLCHMKETYTKGAARKRVGLCKREGVGGHKGVKRKEKGKLKQGNQAKPTGEKVPKRKSVIPPGENEVETREQKVVGICIEKRGGDKKGGATARSGKREDGYRRCGGKKRICIILALLFNSFIIIVVNG
eukprot:380235_1